MFDVQGTGEYKYLFFLLEKGDIGQAKVYYVTNKHMIQIGSNDNYLIKYFANKGNFDAVSWIASESEKINNNTINMIVNGFMRNSNWNAIKWANEKFPGCLDRFNKKEIFTNFAISGDVENAKWIYNMNIGLSDDEFANILEICLSNGIESVANWMLSLDKAIGPAELKARFMDCCRVGDIVGAKEIREKIPINELNIYNYNALYAIYEMHQPAILNWILETIPNSVKAERLQQDLKEGKVDHTMRQVYLVPIKKFEYNYLFIEACVRGDSEFAQHIFSLKNGMRLSPELFEKVVINGAYAVAHMLFNINPNLYAKKDTNYLYNICIDKGNNDMIAWLRTLETNPHRPFIDACKENNIKLATFMQSLDASYEFKELNGKIIDWEVLPIVQELKTKFAQFLQGRELKVKRFNDGREKECLTCSEDMSHNIICPCDHEHYFCGECLPKLRMKCPYCTTTFTGITVYNPK